MSCGFGERLEHGMVATVVSLSGVALVTYLGALSVFVVGIVAVRVVTHATTRIRRRLNPTRAEKHLEKTPTPQAPNPPSQPFVVHVPSWQLYDGIISSDDDS
jgi:hypothetical protein